MCISMLLFRADLKMFLAAFLFCELALLQTVAPAPTERSAKDSVRQTLIDDVNVALLRGILDGVVKGNDKPSKDVAAVNQLGCVTSEEIQEVVDRVQHEIVTAVNATVLSEIRALQDRLQQTPNGN